MFESVSACSSSVIISFWPTGSGVIAVAISLLIMDLMQGIQQQPHRVNMAAKTAIDTRIDDTRLRYFPSMSIQLSHMEVSTPECSFILSFRVFSLSRALVRLPSAAVLLGMKVQHCSPLLCFSLCCAFFWA